MYRDRIPKCTDVHAVTVDDHLFQATIVFVAEEIETRTDGEKGKKELKMGFFKAQAFKTLLQRRKTWHAGGEGRWRPNRMIAWGSTNV